MAFDRMQRRMSAARLANERALVRVRKPEPVFRENVFLFCKNWVACFRLSMICLRNENFEEGAHDAHHK